MDTITIQMLAPPCLDRAEFHAILKYLEGELPSLFSVAHEHSQPAAHQRLADRRFTG